MREPQTKANAGGQKDPSRAFEQASKLFWNLGSKLVDNELPHFKLLGLQMLNQMAEAAQPAQPPSPRYGQVSAAPAYPGIGNELLDRWERNVNGPQMSRDDFLLHFNKNRQDEMPGLNITPLGLRSALFGRKRTALERGTGMEGPAPYTSA